MTVIVCREAVVSTAQVEGRKERSEKLSMRRRHRIITFGMPQLKFSEEEKRREETAEPGKQGCLRRPGYLGPRYTEHTMYAFRMERQTGTAYNWVVSGTVV